MKYNRYSRLEALPGIGAEGLLRLKEAKVLIIGCGALGSLSAMYLCASGVGHISIADFDTIDISNLQRQLFFSEQTIGEKKGAVLSKRMNAINGDVDVNYIDAFITYNKARTLFPEYDFIIDGSDNPASKVMTDKVSFECEINCCIGGVKQFIGQVMSCRNGSIRYSDVFGEEGCNGILPCSVDGVLGPIAGIVASVQASEAIKHICQCGDMLYNKLFTIDILSMKSDLLDIC